MLCPCCAVKGASRGDVLSQLAHAHHHLRSYMFLPLSGAGLSADTSQYKTWHVHGLSALPQLLRQVWVVRSLPAHTSHCHQLNLHRPTCPHRYRQRRSHPTLR